MLLVAIMNTDVRQLPKSSIVAVRKKNYTDYGRQHKLISSVYLNYPADYVSILPFCSEHIGLFVYAW